VIASKIAAHAADLARAQRRGPRRDRELARCRQALDWAGQQRLALDPTTIAARRKAGELPGATSARCAGPTARSGDRAVLGWTRVGKGRSAAEAQIRACARMRASARRRRALAQWVGAES